MWFAQSAQRRNFSFGPICSVEYQYFPGNWLVIASWFVLQTWVWFSWLCKLQIHWYDCVLVLTSMSESAKCWYIECWICRLYDIPKEYEFYFIIVDVVWVTWPPNKNCFNTFIKDIYGSNNSICLIDDISSCRFQFSLRECEGRLKRGFGASLRPRVRQSPIVSLRVSLSKILS